MRKKYESPEEIRDAFIKSGWREDTTFEELTLEEAEEKGYLFALLGIKKGRKYFRMNVCNNIYSDTGKIVCYGNL